MQHRLRFRDDTPPIAWGHADARVRPLCAICHGALPEVPLMMWDSTGKMASFCEECVDKWITSEKAT